MPTVNCGFSDQPERSGQQALVNEGPTLARPGYCIYLAAYLSPFSLKREFRVPGRSGFPFRGNDGCDKR